MADLGGGKKPLFLVQATHMLGRRFCSTDFVAKLRNIMISFRFRNKSRMSLGGGISTQKRARGGNSYPVTSMIMVQWRIFSK